MLFNQIKEYKVINNSFLDKIDCLEKEKLNLDQKKIDNISKELNQFVIQSKVYQNQLTAIKLENSSLKKK